MKLLAATLILLVTLVSCRENNPDNITRKKIASTFNLENIPFGETANNFLQYLNKNISSSEVKEKLQAFADSADYPTNYKIDPWNGSISLYGKSYTTVEMDSMAHYKNMFFSKISILTHEGKLVAVLAENEHVTDSLEMESDSTYDQLVTTLTKEIGSPSLSPQTTADVFYEWVKPDRYLQLDFSTGGRITASSNSPNKQEKTFHIQLLIFQKESANNINQIQISNYPKTKNYLVMKGDFALYAQDPAKNLELANKLLSEKFK